MAVKEEWAVDAVNFQKENPRLVKPVGVSFCTFRAMCETIATLHYSLARGGDADVINGRMTVPINPFDFPEIQDKTRQLYLSGRLDLNDCYDPHEGIVNPVIIFALWAWALKHYKKDVLPNPETIEIMLQKPDYLGKIGAVEPTEGPALGDVSNYPGTFEIDICMDVSGIIIPQWWQPASDVGPELSKMQDEVTDYLINELQIDSEYTEPEDLPEKINECLNKIKLPKGSALITTFGHDQIARIIMCPSKDHKRILESTLRDTIFGLGRDEATAIKNTVRVKLF